ncbi:retrovirus-related pol polyprotein from transposon TNT 1-94 [Tanacetum coccineum]
MQGTKPQFKTRGKEMKRAGLLFRMFRVDRIQDKGTMQGVQVQQVTGELMNKVRNANPSQARQIKCYNCNGGQDNTVDKDVDEQPVQYLTLTMDNVFQANDFNLHTTDTIDPEQIFWSKDLIKMKAKALKEQTPASRPIKANFDEIERKNLLIANDNLIADCLFKDVFHVATNSELNVSSFTEMHDAHTSLKARCLELEVELSDLHDKIQKDNHDELLKRFSNLEVNHLNLQLKYQNLKESFGNNTSPPTRDVPDFDSVFVIEKMKASIQGKDNAIKKLRMQISQLNEADRTRDFRTLDFQITQLTEKINVLQEQNELFRAENGKIKQHYKELYDSIKITRAKHLEQTTALLTENESLKVQIQNKLSCVNKDQVKPKVLAPGKYAIDVEPIPPRNRNNREVHLVYLKHLKESVETLREIVEEAKVERPLDSSLASACRYTKHSQELLEYVIGTCPKALNTRDNKHASTSLPKKKQVTFEEQCAMSKSNTHKPVEQLNCQKTNVPVPPSTGVNSCTDASRSQPRSNTKKNRILPAKSVNMKKVEEHPRTIKSSLKTTNRVDSSISSKRTVINSNSHSVCQTCNKCLISANHDMCVVTYLHSVNASPSVKNVVRKVKQVWKPKQVKQVWKPTGNILTTVGYQWMPTGRTFTLGEQCPLTRLTKPNKVSAIAYANPREPNHNWGSNFPNSPSLSVFKCRHVEVLSNLLVVQSLQEQIMVVASAFKPLELRPMRVQTINGKKYILVIVDDYSRFTWVKFLRSKDETPEFRGLHSRTTLSKDGTVQKTVASSARTLSSLQNLNKELSFADQFLVEKSQEDEPEKTNTESEIQRLVPNPFPTIPYVPLTNKELDILFQPMFNEYLEPQHVERPVSPAPTVPVPVNSADTPSSTTVDQDAPSPRLEEERGEKGEEKKRENGEGGREKTGKREREEGGRKEEEGEEGDREGRRAREGGGEEKKERRIRRRGREEEGEERERRGGRRGRKGEVRGEKKERGREEGEGEGRGREREKGGKERGSSRGEGGRRGGEGGGRGEKGREERGKEEGGG